MLLSRQVHCCICEFRRDKRHQSSVNEKKEAAMDAIAHFGNNLHQYPRM